MTKQRNSNIELLRIILMMMIIMLHMLVHGVNGEIAVFHGDKPLPTTISESFISILLMISVNCYVLISGYYGIRLSKKSFIRVYSPVLFYSVLISFIFFVNGSISFTRFIVGFFPIITVRWWFATCFIILMLISPILNYCLEGFYKTDKKKLVLFLIVCSFISFFFDGFSFSNIIGLHSLGFSTICLSYSIGFVLRMSSNEIKLKMVRPVCYFGLYLGASLCSFVATLILLVITGKNHWFRISMYCSPITIFASVAFLMFFLSMRSRTNTIINRIAQTTFVIYLIHENELLRPLIYGFFKPWLYKNSIFEYPFLIICVLSVFCIGVIVEFSRQTIFNVLGGVGKWRKY